MSRSSISSELLSDVVSIKRCTEELSLSFDLSFGSITHGRIQTIQISK